MKQTIAQTLTQELQERKYDKLWPRILGDQELLTTLVNCAKEEELMDLLTHFGPKTTGEVLDGTDFGYLCSALLPLCFGNGFYDAIGLIYGLGYDNYFDPLCQSRHPLVFAAQYSDHGKFAACYIKWQQHFGTLSFDGYRRCGRTFRTVPEEIILADAPVVLAQCLKAGLDPSAFTWQGDRLLDAAPNETIASLLCKYGGRRATERERLLVGAAHKLQTETLCQADVEALMADTPLLRISWQNGNTACSGEETADLFYEAAAALHPPLLEYLYPYAKTDLDVQQQIHILKTIMGQEHALPSRAIYERTDDIAACLEALLNVGFRLVPTEAQLLSSLMHTACWTIYFCSQCTIATQQRIFSALWKICGSPKNEAIIEELSTIAQEHPEATLEHFVSLLKYRYWEEFV